jgi:hypothetical protein
MARIIRLTERDLTRIVRRVIREQDEEVGEGFLSNLFGGGKKEDETPTPKPNYGDRKTVNGIEFDEIYTCPNFSGKQTKYYTHGYGDEEINMAFISYSHANGKITSGDACSFSETGYNKY